MFGSLDVSTSALTAQRAVLDTIAGNIANAYATRGPNGEPTPYRRRVALLGTGDPNRGQDAPGVHVVKVAEDPSPFRLEYDPTHPDAIKEGKEKGYVRMPNVDYSTEMVNAMLASRVYEANITVMEATKSMAAASLRLLA
ncbi:MAG TPA: flagellar basal body rod protein FlgC [Phycisphaerae bacterium]|jgi:flagellar basal-body rod protein FlgC